MNSFRITLANIRFPDADESIALAKQYIGRASDAGAGVVCFPECFVPGYRGGSKSVQPPDQEFLERAWSAIASAAADAEITVILGTERFINGALSIMRAPDRRPPRPSSVRTGPCSVTSLTARRGCWSAISTSAWRPALWPKVINPSREEK
ncbi:MAG TPA: nitrilase-related carbon-nitrogen hydrolase [Blastocatellia bacterium]|jgi:predicted amidohydrolase|nr:nitrilase-related carbon-nitrogen hydrolase [Blastocatellia bacterium]